MSSPTSSMESDPAGDRLEAEAPALRCFLCPFEDFAGNTGNLLAHLLTSHRIVIDQLEGVASLTGYMDGWRAILAKLKQPITEILPLVHVQSTPDGEVSSYYLLSPSVPEDAELREKLAMSHGQLPQTPRRKQRVEADSEDEDFEDWVDDEPATTKCLFSDEVFDTPQACIEHAKEVHGFDLAQQRKALGLDFYGAIRLVNYLRHRQARRAKENLPVEVPTSLKAADFASDEYLVPFDDADPLLCALDDEDGAGQDAEGEAELTPQEIESRRLASLELIGNVENPKEVLENMSKIAVEIHTDEAEERRQEAEREEQKVKMNALAAPFEPRKGFDPNAQEFVPRGYQQHQQQHGYDAQQHQQHQQQYAQYGYQGYPQYAKSGPGSRGRGKRGRGTAYRGRQPRNFDPEPFYYGFQASLSPLSVLGSLTGRDSNKRSIMGEPPISVTPQLSVTGAPNGRQQVSVVSSGVACARPKGRGGRKMAAPQMSF